MFFLRTTFAPPSKTLNIVGWVPLKSVDDSDYGSLDSDEKAELDGEEFIEILDPTTGETIEPDSVSAKRVVFLAFSLVCHVPRRRSALFIVESFGKFSKSVAPIFTQGSVG